MSQFIKTLTLSTYLQLLNYTRIKQAVFFTIVFPVLIFVLFGNIWGVDGSEYLYFLLTGVIAATTASGRYPSAVKLNTVETTMSIPRPSSVHGLSVSKRSRERPPRPISARLSSRCTR